jgi:DNA-binding response OmpR family regulator
VARILIVEDDVDLVETYTDLLEAQNHSVTAVLKASEAIRTLTNSKVDVVILDLNLPGDSGVIVINFIRSYKPISDMKIIVASGHSDMLNQIKYVSSRVDAILSKPISNQELLALIGTTPSSLS